MISMRGTIPGPRPGTVRLRNQTALATCQEREAAPVLGAALPHSDAKGRRFQFAGLAQGDGGSPLESQPCSRCGPVGCDAQYSQYSQNVAGLLHFANTANSARKGRDNQDRCSPSWRWDAGGLTRAADVTGRARSIRNNRHVHRHSANTANSALEGKEHKHAGSGQERRSQAVVAVSPPGHGPGGTMRTSSGL
jgi:hypothetical protein